MSDLIDMTINTEIHATSVSVSVPTVDLTQLTEAQAEEFELELNAAMHAIVSKYAAN